MCVRKFGFCRYKYTYIKNKKQKKTINYSECLLTQADYMPALFNQITYFNQSMWLTQSISDMNKKVASELELDYELE